MGTNKRIISMEEVARHSSPDDCWLVLCGKVYDLTMFHKSHPGGSKIITENAGKDATAVFLPIHPSDIGDRLLSPDLMLGTVDPKTVKPEHVVAAPEKETEVLELPPGERIPDIREMLNYFDFEAVAKLKMSKEGWYYYSSGADDEITLRENRVAFQRIWLKPRVMIDVDHIDTSTYLFGYKSALPLYITATALGKLAHPDGEVAIVKAANSSGIMHMLPTLASCSLDEMLQARAPDQVVFSQLYVNRDRSKTKEYIEKLQDSGVKALFITVDAPQLGRREKDMRNKFLKQGTAVQEGEDISRDSGVARAISSYIDPSLNWNDLAWFLDVSKMPVLLKGVQCAEDAVLAFRYGCAGIVLSNHGGRQLDLARSGIEVLPEVMEALRKEPGYTKENFPVFVDGGIRRGADIFKAVALGATAVGIGRPSIYALAAYGQEGIERMIEVFKEELEMCMSLMGTPSIHTITSDHVLTRNLADHIPTPPSDNLLTSTYEPLKTASKL